MTTNNLTPLNLISPNLPLAPSVYNQQYQEQLNNVLRLFFRQVCNTVNINVTSDAQATTPIPYVKLPSPKSVGVAALYFISDSTTDVFYAAVTTGGGTYAVPVFSDGTNWRVG